MLLYSDPVFLDHETGNHPENAARLPPTLQWLDSNELGRRAVCPNWPPASLDRIRLVHSDQHIQHVREFAEGGGGFIEQDTFVCPASYHVALRAAGAVCDAVEKICGGEDQTAFCLIRPPGHHAAANHPAGFCLFNNVAIGARVAIREFGIERVLIVDWDVHHGDGTQAIFWEDDQVGYFSIHRDSFYPFTGSAAETGAGAGAGTGATKNVPIRFGTSRSEQVSIFANELLQFAEQIKPQLIFISAGFDAHRDDPIGSLGLEAVDFGAMTRTVIEIAERFAEGKIISVLEGGYNPTALAECVGEHLKLLIEPAQRP